MNFRDFDAEHDGTIGDAMLTLFVLLSLEGLPETVERGLELSPWTVLYFISFTIIAALLLLNLPARAGRAAPARGLGLRPWERATT